MTLVASSKKYGRKIGKKKGHKNPQYMQYNKCLTI